MSGNIVNSLEPELSLEDLYKVEGKAELVHGEIVEMPPVGEDPGFASLKIASRMSRWG